MRFARLGHIGVSILTQQICVGDTRPSLVIEAKGNLAQARQTQNRRYPIGAEIAPNRSSSAKIH